MAYILIIILHSSGSAVNMHEFNNRKACELAATQLNASFNVIGVSNEDKAICFSKS